jgi:hypothetical protein
LRTTRIELSSVAKTDYTRALGHGLAAARTRDATITTPVFAPALRPIDDAACDG